VGDPGTDGLDDAGSLMSEQVGVVVADAAVAVREVGVADAAALDPHDDVVCAGVGDDDVHKFDGSVLLTGDNALDGGAHG
jgi:hypothetical protein